MSDDLINAQNKMTEMLYHLDKFCKQENINYWIDAGSLLGAVRHQGFIPWDDDIDVCMSREDYNKFISYAPRAIKNDLFIQTIYSDPEYPKIHIPCKLRMDASLHVEKDEIEYGLGDENDYHRGLFIDIFPYDKYSKNVFFRKNIERLLSKIYRIKFLSFLGDNIKGNKCYLQKIGRLIPLKILSKILSVQTSLMNKRKENYYFAAGCEVPFERALFENDEIFPLDRINFNGIEVNCPNKTHEYLVKMFGDNYMELPPVSQRETHHAILKVY